MLGQRKTVDSVLKVFTNALRDLEEVEKQQAALAEQHQKEALDHQRCAQAADSERQRSIEVARKLRAIVS